MDKYIAQGDGFPGDNEFLMLIQSIIGEVSNLAALGGTDYILKGCSVTGANAAAGWMVLKGEVMPFDGGAIGAQVTVIETVQNTTYLEDLAPADGQGDSKPTYFYRKAQFGSGGSYTVNWADLKPINPLSVVQKAIVPVNGIIMYSGAMGSIPTGWALCDGTDGTPNLKGKFIAGYDPGDPDHNAIGKQGGAKSVTLTEAQIPAHNHSGQTASGGAHRHSVPNNNKKSPASVDTTPGEWGSHIESNENVYTGYSGTHTHSLTTNHTGGGTTHENRPPFYTLAYIMYKG